MCSILLELAFLHAKSKNICDQPRGERVPQSMEIQYSGANIKGDMSQTNLCVGSSSHT